MEAPLRRIVFHFALTILTMQATCMAATNSSTSTNEIYTEFIKTQCNTTTYPSVCNKALSSYASKIKTNPQTLCYAALSVALQAARNASWTVEKLLARKGLSATEKATVAECVEEVGESAEMLKQCLEALGTIRNAKGRSAVEFQMDNMKTWASAAITNQYTCTDELDEDSVSVSVKKKISKVMVKVARHTSNALSIINHLTY